MCNSFIQSNTNTPWSPVIFKKEYFFLCLEDEKLLRGKGAVAKSKEW